MASYTPNLNLYKPDDSDDYKDFREGFNDNMDILDQGGGGDSVQYVQILDHGSFYSDKPLNPVRRPRLTLGTPIWSAVGRAGSPP